MEAQNFEFYAPNPPNCGGTYMQCSLQDFAMGGYILECTEYLHHNLMCFVIQVIILVALVVHNC